MQRKSKAAQRIALLNSLILQYFTLVIRTQRYYVSLQFYSSSILCACSAVTIHFTFEKRKPVHMIRF